MEDERIIVCCLDGEPEAFELIVNKYQTGVRSLAWGVLGNKEEAEDAAQKGRFRPIVVDGKRTRGKFYLSVDFRLRGDNDSD